GRARGCRRTRRRASPLGGRRDGSRRGRLGRGPRGGLPGAAGGRGPPPRRRARGAMVPAPRTGTPRKRPPPPSPAWAPSPPAVPSQDAPAPPVDELSERSLEQLLGMRVVSASNRPENRPEAPATVIVITREDIRERGYTELSEILDDLPGMDVIRPYGDTYFK